MLYKIGDTAEEGGEEGSISLLGDTPTYSCMHYMHNYVDWISLEGQPHCSAMSRAQGSYRELVRHAAIRPLEDV